MGRKAYLTLENGQVFEGEGFGAAAGDVVGEVVFTTGMTGYMETLTDKSCHGCIVLQTFPLIGNYGAITADAESARPHALAYVAKEICGAPSNFRSEGALSDYLARHGVVGISGIDTRALAKTIREQGAMNGCVSARPLKAAAALAALARCGTPRPRRGRWHDRRRRCPGRRDRHGPAS